MNLFSQNQPYADSLIQILNSKNGLEKLEILNEITRFSSSPEDKIEFASLLNEESKAQENTNYQIFALRQLGNAYRKKGNLQQSLEYLFQAASLAQKSNDLINLSKTYTEIASTYNSGNDVNNALAYNTKSIEILRKLDDELTLGIILVNTGYDYYSADKYDTALLYYDEALPLLIAQDSKIGIAYNIGNRALVKWKVGEIDTAIIDLQQAIELLKPLGDEYGMADYYNQLGNIYYEQGDIQKAELNLSKGVQMAQKVDLKEQVRDASMLLSNLYRSDNQVDSAYHYLHQYVAMRDSIANEETIQKLANQRADFEISLKQVELDIAEQRRKTQLIISVSVGIFLFLAVVGATIIYRNYKQKLKLSEELAQLNESKNKLLSIISHDLRGPMAGFTGVAFMIRSAIQTNSQDMLMEVADEVEKSSTRLSGVLETLLHWAIKQQGSMDVQLESLSVKKLFLELKETYYNQAKSKNIDLDITKIDASSINVDRNMTYTIFRNLIGNALKFTPDGGKVAVSSSLKGEQVEVVVSDTGIGIPKEKIATLFDFKGEKTSFGTRGEKGLGLGLSLVKEFVDNNNGQVHVASEPGKGTSFKVSLPAFV